MTTFQFEVTTAEIAAIEGTINAGLPKGAVPASAESWLEANLRQLVGQCVTASKVAGLRALGLPDELAQVPDDEVGALVSVRASKAEALKASEASGTIPADVNPLGQETP